MPQNNIPQTEYPTKEILKLAVDIGEALLVNGGEIYRVEDTILYILREFNIGDCDVYVISNGIFASAHENLEDACSVVRHIPLGSVHLGRIAAINQLTRDLCRGRCSIERGRERLEECKLLPSYPNHVLTLAAGLGGAGFCYLFGGSFLDAGMAFLLAALEQQLLFIFRKNHFSRIIITILASSFVSLSCEAMRLMGLNMNWDMVIIGGVMLLVPGIAFTTSIRDFYNGDYLSGTIHMIDALITAVCTAVGSCMPLIIRSITGGAL